MPKKKSLQGLYQELSSIAQEKNTGLGVSQYEFEEYMNSSGKNRNQVITAKLAGLLRKDSQVSKDLKSALPESYRMAKAADKELARRIKKGGYRVGAPGSLSESEVIDSEMVEKAKAAEKEKAAKAAQRAAERAKKKPAKQVSAREKLLEAAEAKMKEEEKIDKRLSADKNNSMQGQLMGRAEQRKLRREALSKLSKPSGWLPHIAYLNSRSQGTHDDRHGVYYVGDPPVKKQKEFGTVSGTRPEATQVRTEQGMLRGATYTPAGYENKQPQKVVLFFSGSGGPSEEQSANAIESHLENGAKVVCLNYRGYGKSETLDANGNKKGTFLSEHSLYNDGMAMYDYVTKPVEEGGLGYAPENVVLHGYSMGGAVASRVAAEVGQMNIARAIAEDRPLTESEKLGGLIMHSPMPSMKQAATLESGSFAGAIASTSGGYNSIEHTNLARQCDPNLPIHVIGGARENHVILNEKENTPIVLEGDWLNPKISGYWDGLKDKKGVTYAEGKGDHFGKNVENHEKLRDMTTMSREEINQKEMERNKTVDHGMQM